VSNACRIGWYERGRVTRFVPGRAKADIPADEPAATANLKTGPQGVKIVEAEIDGRPWFGRLAPRRAGLNEGLVLLFKSPHGARV
jgi:hypothetical protein